MDETYGTETRFPRWVPAHADVLVVPLRELPAGMGVYVCSLGERAAPPSSWSRALTTSTGETASENVVVFSALLGPSVDTRSCVSSCDIWKISSVVFLRPLVSGSHLLYSVLA